MRKIFDFSTYVELFEADSPMGSKLYDQTLGLIISTILNSYSSELAYPVSPYDSKIEADIDFIKSKSIQEKPQAFKTILDKVKSSSESNSSPMVVKVVDAWVAAGSKAADALNSLISQYKDDANELDSINTKINSFLDDYLVNLEDAAKNESLNSERNNTINEEFSFWQGKKGIVEDLATRAAVASSKLANFKGIMGMEKVIPGLENQLQQISNRIGQLEQSKRKDIDKLELEKIDDQIANIVAQAESASLKAAKENKTNQAAAGVLVQAIGLVSAAKKLEQQYLDEKQKEEEKKRSSLIKTTISGTIDYDPDNIGKVNPEVKSFQQLVTDKFSKIKSLTSLPQWKKMGTDGKFGPNTRDIVKILKAGFDISDKSGDITKELVDEIQIQADTIKESGNSKIFSFDSFNILNEAAFDISKAVSMASSLQRSAPLKSKPSGTSKGTSGDPERDRMMQDWEEKSKARKALEDVRSPEDKKRWKFLTDIKVPAWKNFGSVTIFKSKGSKIDDGVRVLWKSKAVGDKRELNAEKGYISRFFDDGSYKYFNATSSGGTGSEVSRGTWKIDSSGKKMILTDQDGKTTDIW